MAPKPVGMGEQILGCLCTRPRPWGLARKERVRGFWCRRPVGCQHTKLNRKYVKTSSYRVRGEKVWIIPAVLDMWDFL